MHRFAIELLATTTLLSASCIAATQQPDPEPQPGDRTFTVRATGRLLDHDYLPAADVPLTVVAHDENDYRPAIKATKQRSDASGRFDLEIACDEAAARLLLIGGRRFAVLRTKLPTKAPAAPVDLGTLTLALGFTATGRVRTSDGAPPTDAVVAGEDLLRSRSFLSQARRTGSSYCYTTTTASKSGIFVLPGMVRSLGRLVVRCNGYYDAVLEPVAVGSPMDVTLQRAPTIRGRVINTEGAPIAGQIVSCGRATATADADGNFELTLRTPSDHIVRAGRNVRGNYQRAQAELESADTPLTLTFDALEGDDDEAKGDKLRLRVLDGDGKPVPEFEAFACWHRSNQRSYQLQAAMLAEVRDDEARHVHGKAGDVELAGPARSYEDSALVMVRAPGLGWGLLDTTPDKVGGEPLEVHLGPATTIKGRIVDVKTGEGIAGVHVVPTPKLDDRARQFVQGGYFNMKSGSMSPDAAVTDAQGNWQIEGLPHEQLDLLLYIEDHVIREPLALDLRDGKQPEPLELKVANRATLKGTVQLQQPLAGLRIRMHWHRPNMMNSSWLTDTDGSIPLADDGTFTFEGLPPRQYRPELVLPAAPRGMASRKVHCDLWDGSSPSANYVTTPPKITKLHGTVAGDVPWSRLGVFAVTPVQNMAWGSWSVPGSIALLRPDRSYRLMLPEEAVRLVLVDVLTGVALAHRDVDTAALQHSVDWDGAASGLDVVLRDGEAQRDWPVTLSYRPPDEYWPVAHANLPQNYRTGMTTSSTTGHTVQLWLPTRDGMLYCRSDERTLDLEVRRLRAPRLIVQVADNGIVKVPE